MFIACALAVAMVALFIAGVVAGKHHERGRSLAVAVQSGQGANDHVNDLSIAYALNNFQLTAEDMALVVASGGHIKNTPLIDAVYVTNNTDRVCKFISAVFGLYNDDGTKRGEETESIGNLAPKGIWRFELEREHMLYHNPKLEELTWILDGETKIRSKKFK